MPFGLLVVYDILAFWREVLLIVSDNKNTYYISRKCRMAGSLIVIGRSGRGGEGHVEVMQSRP